MSNKLLLIAATIFAVGVSLIGLDVAHSKPPEKVEVLITFDRTPGPDEEDFVREKGGKIKRSFHLVPGIAATVPETAIQGLMNNPHIKTIEPDVTFDALDVELNDSWGVKRIGAGAVHALGNKGAGVKIAVIDSGIDYTHPE
ncbi:MAG: protease inhibitor I9 family protein, partial [Dehalococcoidia bacterium]|nr:protease inhibitor I9 family protein [Dehalococcoidia bacterium]